MLKFLQTPGRTKKIVLSGILLFICVAMVTYLIPGFMSDRTGGGGPTGMLVRVGDQEITVTDAQRAAQNMVRQRFGGRSVPPQFMSIFVQQAMEQLIGRKVMLNEAERVGLRVSDEELRYDLEHGQLGTLFFPNGNFIGQEQYEAFLTQNGSSVAQFEADQKDDIRLRKLYDIIAGAATVSDGEVKQEFLHRNSKVKFEYAVLTMDDVMKQIHPADAELKAFYEKNKKNYENSIPEKRKAQYVLIESQKLKEKAQVSADDLRRYYNQHQDEYRVPEQVKVRHILVKTPPPGPDGKPDEKATAAARAKAEDILKKLKAGGNLAELAKKNSDDPGSAQQGGELGWIGRGRTVPEFEKSAFSLNKGETSGLVQSSFGFHIIQLEDKQAAHLKPLEEVKSQIEPNLAAEKAAREMETLANTIQVEARTTGLNSAAAKHGLQVITTPLFGQGDTLPGIGTAPEFAAAVFAARVKDPASAVRLPQGYAVVQLTEIKPASTPTFEEAKARVESEFKSERAGALQTQKIQEISDRAHAERSLKKAAAEAGATLKTSELVTLQQQVPDIGAMSGPASVIFSLKPGEVSVPISTGRGVVLVASVLEKQEPPPADFDKSKDEIRESLVAEKRNAMLELFVSNLRERMQKEGKIRYNQQEMDRLLGKTGQAGS